MQFITKSQIHNHTDSACMRKRNKKKKKLPDRKHSKMACGHKLLFIF